MLRVGIIRGGANNQYDASLKTGAHIISHLRSDKLNKKYIPVDIFIDKQGSWHMNGLPVDFEKISNKVDVIWNALHGEYGEDGKIQQTLNHWKIPYTGSGIFPSALAYNKLLSKERFANLGINTPRHILYPIYQEDVDGPRNEYAMNKAREVLAQLPPPWIVKPLAGSYFMGIHVCKTFPSLVRAFEDGVNANTSILVEEMLEGKEASVGVIEGFRGKDVYTMPAIEIHSSGREVCPGNFSSSEKQELERLATLIHKEFGLKHYSQVDFILHPKNGIYAIEVNTLPRLGLHSLIPKHLDSVGISMPDFIEHIIELAKKSR